MKAITANCRIVKKRSLLTMLNEKNIMENGKINRLSGWKHTKKRRLFSQVNMRSLLFIYNKNSSDDEG
jgi:hypothetical protein